MSDPTGLTDQFKSDELKKRLVAVVKEANKKLSSEIQTFLDKPHRSEEDVVELLNTIIAIVDEILSADDWESTLFLRNQARSIKAIKEDAERELRHKLSVKEAKKPRVAELTEDEVAVYISLFQTEGYNMERWAVQLRSLNRYVVGRPIYKNEEDIQKRIRLRNGGANEAYVIVAVKKNDVKKDPFAPELKDQFDHPLLQLKDTAVQQGRVLAFVHQNTRYFFQNGELVKSS